VHTTTVDAAHLRRACVAACSLNAVSYAGLVPRLPEVEARLGLNSTALGAAPAAVPLAALAGVGAPVLGRAGRAAGRPAA
jgi:hypothetical protein